jgi:FtsP/CotA-like multicopper oxidase with cupredoxin domain
MGVYTCIEFTEGEYAIIYVKNEMKEETSIHWHGLVLPNFMMVYRI